MPSWAEQVYTNKVREKKQAKIEALHFPVDLLFVAIGYTIPKIIEGTIQVANTEPVTPDMVNKYTELVRRVGIYWGESIVILMLVPFVVFATKFAENNYFGRRKRWIAQTLGCYLVAIGMIWISIFII